jgi:hypothetical protein
MEGEEDIGAAEAAKDSSKGGGRKKAKSEEERLVEHELLSEFGFSTFILSLSTSALVHLGELPDPITSKKEINLQLAEQTISIIEMLKEKTKGNRTTDEDELIDNVLYEVRLKYIRSSS